VLDLAAAEALGYRPATTYPAALTALCGWLADGEGRDWRKRFPVFTSYPSDPFDYAAEDAFLARR
jgi:hypothetical protein